MNIDVRRFKKRNMKKKFNKKLLTFGLLGIFALALVTGALLTYYGKIQQTVTVEQGLSIDGNAWDVPIVEDRATTSIENAVFLSVHYLDNDASIDAEVGMVTECVGAGSCNEVEVKHFATNLRSGTLELSLKNADWLQVPDEVNIVVTYNTNVATGITRIVTIDALPSEFTLIYYADEEFAEDGTRLTTPGQAYELDVGSIIPISSADGNLKDDANYCAAPDNYEHCRGIKLWAINDAIVDNRISWSGDWQSTYYFETDMLGWNHLPGEGELVNPFEVNSNSELDFVIVSEFPVGMEMGDYTLTTTVDLV